HGKSQDQVTNGKRIQLSLKNHIFATAKNEVLLSEPCKGSNYGMRILHRFISRMHRPFTGPSFGTRAMSNSAGELGTRVRAGIWKEGGFRQMDAARDQLLVSNLKPCSSAITTYSSHCLCYIRACPKNAFIVDRYCGVKKVTARVMATLCGHVACFSAMRFS
ncbi:hypothetical protein D6D01_06117, partial [Aureobasidium pullulans]